MVTAKKIDKKDYKLVKTVSDPDLKKKWTTIKNLFTKNKIVVIDSLSDYIKDKKIGVNEFRKSVDMSSRQYYRLMDESENVTLMTMAEIAEFMGCELEIKFKKKK